MRLLRPWLGNLLVVLLLMQSGGAPSACLGAMTWVPGQALCETAPASDDTRPAPGHPAEHAGCVACAPISPALLPTLPDLPRPTLLPTMLGANSPAVSPAPSRPLPFRQRPRGPPISA